MVVKSVIIITCYSIVEKALKINVRCIVVRACLINALVVITTTSSTLLGAVTVGAYCQYVMAQV